MKGLIFIILTYAIVISLCALIKYLKYKYFNGDVKKESEQPSASKIYYITNTSKRKKKPRQIKPDIAIKGSIIDKCDDEF